LVKVVIKGGAERRGCEWRKKYGNCLVLLPLFVFGYISDAVVKGASVRDCRELELSTDGTIGFSVVVECVRGSVSVVKSWGMIGGRSKDRGQRG
jgi:hypothetical protein